MGYQEKVNDTYFDPKTGQKNITYDEWWACLVALSAEYFSFRDKNRVLVYDFQARGARVATDHTAVLLAQNKSKPA